MTDFDAAKRKRRLRYGLRSLLGLVLLLSLPLGWYGWKIQKADRHRAAEPAIRDSGGQVAYSHLIRDPPGPMWLQGILRKASIADVQEVRMGSKATDTELEQLRLFTNLQILNASDTQITDLGLQQLEGLTGLKRLDLGTTRVTDAGLQHLKTLNGLEWLALERTQVTDAGLEHLKGLPRLQFVHLEHTQISDEGLAHLKELPNLVGLHLGNTRIAGPGLKHFQDTKVPCLHLYLENTDIGDAGLSLLKGVGQLGELVLDNTKVTDAGLKHLNGLTKLHSLQLSGTGITDVGLEHLEELARRQLPLAQENLRNESKQDLPPGESGELPKVHTVLKKLDLNETQITDSGLKRLERFVYLEQLSLTGTQVTSEGVNQLKQSLPKCTVYH